MIGRRALLAGVCCLTLACSSEGAGDVVVAPGPSAPGAGSTADPAPPGSSVAGGSAPDGQQPAGRAGESPGQTTSPPSSVSAGGSPATSAPSRGAEPTPVVVDDGGPLGSMGPAFLRADVPSVVLEVDGTQGRTLSARAAQAVGEVLADHGQKRVRSGGVGTVPASDVYTVGDLRRLAAAHRTTRSSTEQLSVYVLVLDGRFEAEDATGVAFGASSFALFPETISGGLLPTMSYSRFEQSVAVHELGHLFGLVNLTGRGGFHEDPDHPGHSASRSSVMFWAVEDVTVANLFRGGPPTEFDDGDIRELDLIRSGS